MNEVLKLFGYVIALVGTILWLAGIVLFLFMAGALAFLFVFNSLVYQWLEFIKILGL